MTAILKISIFLSAALLSLLCGYACNHGTIDPERECGITQTDTEGNIIGMDDADDWQPRRIGGGFPTSFQVEPAYPNPAGKDSVSLGRNPGPPAAIIRYAIAEDRQQVKVTVGEQTRTLVDREQSAGFYAVQWDLLDDNGSTVADGCYSVDFEVTASDTVYRSRGDILIRR